MMKRSKFLIVLALIGVSASFWQCGSDSAPAPNPQDEQLKKLSQTWKISTSAAANPVTFNSTPVTGYDNFEITMSGTPGNATFDYTVAGRPSGVKTPWNTAGKFTFDATNFSTLVKREDDILVTYSVTATQLQMTFTYAGAGFTGRTSNVEGSWSFTFGL